MQQDDEDQRTDQQPEGKESGAAAVHEHGSPDTHGASGASGAMPTIDTQGQASPGFEESESVVGDYDASMRATGPARGQAGSGIPGLGGMSGGTSDAAGVGAPGGAQPLGVGPAPTRDASAGGTLGISGRAHDVVNESASEQEQDSGKPSSASGQGVIGTPGGPVESPPTPGEADIPNGAPVEAETEQRATHPIPEEPIPGHTREPGPEAQT